jgi:hypothetical protein
VEKKPKNSSLKNQIRSIGRMIRKDLPPEVREALEKKLDDLKKQQDIHFRLAFERKIFLRNRKVRFFERRKIERSIRRLEKLHRSTSGGYVQDAEIGGQLNRLKEDLEYVRVSILYNPNPVSCVSRKNRRVLLFHNFFSVLSSATFPSYPIE